MASLYDLLVTADPATEASALQDALRKRNVRGTLLAGTGDRVLSPLGQGMQRDAQQQGAGMVDVAGQRLRQAMAQHQARAQMEQQQVEAARWEREQGERERHNRAAEMRPSIIFGEGGQQFRVRGDAPAAPIVDTSGKPVLKPAASGHGGGMAEVAERKRTMLSDGQVKIVAQYDTGLDSLRNIMAQKAAIDTGPAASKRNALAAKVGLDDPTISAFRASVGDSLATYIRSLSGAAVSDRERAFLVQNVPKMEDNDQVFNAKLKTVMDRLERLREIEINLFGAQGKDTSGFNGGGAAPAHASGHATAEAPKRRRFNPATGKLE